MFKEYFGHDYNARHDFKIMGLRTKMGFEGYGLFWMLVEELYCNGNTLPLDGIEVLAHCNKVGAAKLRRVVTEFGLFEVDEEAGTFSSRRIGEALSSRSGKAEERKASAASAAAARWGARKAKADAERIDDTMRSGYEADAERIDDTMRSDANKRKEEKRKEKKTTSTSSTTTPEGERATSGKAAETPPAPSAPPQGATDADIGAEVRGLLANESVRYQIHQKSGMDDLSAIEGYIPEFAGQLALEGKGGEHGMKLAMHFAYWLGKKRDRQLKQLKANVQTGNYGKNIVGNNGDGPGLADGPDPAARLGWEYPAAAYGVKPTDAEIREELRHRKVLNTAYNLITGGIPGR